MKTEPSSLPAVHLASIGIEMAPEVITSATLEDQLAAAWSTMGIAPGQLEQLTGVRERRWWPEGTSISEMAANACQKALESSHLPASIIGQLAYTGVCRESFEPATACSVAARLDLSRGTELFDISNACLGAIDGVVLASDASHFYENLHRNRPFIAAMDVAAMLDTFRKVERLADSPHHIVPGHDPLVMHQYPAPSPSVQDIVVCLDVKAITS